MKQPIVRVKPLTREQRDARERAGRQIALSGNEWRERFMKAVLAARVRAKFGRSKESGRAVS